MKTSVIVPVPLIICEREFKKCIFLKLYKTYRIFIQRYIFIQNLSFWTSVSISLSFSNIHSWVDYNIPSFYLDHQCSPIFSLNRFYKQPMDLPLMALLHWSIIYNKCKYKGILPFLVYFSILKILIFYLVWKVKASRKCC